MLTEILLDQQYKNIYQELIELGYDKEECEGVTIGLYEMNNGMTVSEEEIYKEFYPHLYQARC